jgi:hypothetical protein
MQINTSKKKEIIGRLGNRNDGNRAAGCREPLAVSASPSSFLTDLASAASGLRLTGAEDLPASPPWLRWPTWPSCSAPVRSPRCPQNPPSVPQRIAVQRIEPSRGFSEYTVPARVYRLGCSFDSGLAVCVGCSGYSRRVGVWTVPVP